MCRRVISTGLFSQGGLEMLHFPSVARSILIALLPTMVDCAGRQTAGEEQGRMTKKAADCFQCSTPGSATLTSTLVSCSTGVTNESACNTACRPNIGSIMNGSCSDRVQCK